MVIVSFFAIDKLSRAVRSSDKIPFIDDPSLPQKIETQRALLETYMLECIVVAVIENGGY
jgi:hypothetical protein